MLLLGPKLSPQILYIAHPGQNHRAESGLQRTPDIVRPQLCKEIHEHLVVRRAVHLVNHQHYGPVSGSADIAQLLEQLHQCELAPSSLGAFLQPGQGCLERLAPFFLIPPQSAQKGLCESRCKGAATAEFFRVKGLEIQQDHAIHVLQIAL